MNIIDTSFDFTQDTKDYWKNWWSTKDGDELLRSRNVPDPDGQSKKLHELLKDN